MYALPSLSIAGVVAIAPFATNGHGAPSTVASSGPAIAAAPDRCGSCPSIGHEGGAAEDTLGIPAATPSSSRTIRITER
jgi:hypothetical protein